MVRYHSFYSQVITTYYSAGRLLKCGPLRTLKQPDIGTSSSICSIQNCTFFLGQITKQMPPKTPRLVAVEWSPSLETPAQPTASPGIIILTVGELMHRMRAKRSSALTTPRSPLNPALVHGQNSISKKNNEWSSEKRNRSLIKNNASKENNIEELNFWNETPQNYARKTIPLNPAVKFAENSALSQFSQINPTIVTPKIKCSRTMTKFSGAPSSAPKILGPLNDPPTPIISDKKKRRHTYGVTTKRKVEHENFLLTQKLHSSAINKSKKLKTCFQNISNCSKSANVNFENADDENKKTSSDYGDIVDINIFEPPLRNTFTNTPLIQQKEETLMRSSEIKQKEIHNASLFVTPKLFRSQSGNTSCADVAKLFEENEENEASNSESIIYSDTEISQDLLLCKKPLLIDKTFQNVNIFPKKDDTVDPIFSLTSPLLLQSSQLNLDDNSKHKDYKPIPFDYEITSQLLLSPTRISSQLKSSRKEDCNIFDSSPIRNSINYRRFEASLPNSSNINETLGVDIDEASKELQDRDPEFHKMIEVEETSTGSLKYQALQVSISLPKSNLKFETDVLESPEIHGKEIDNISSNSNLNEENAFCGVNVVQNIEGDANDLKKGNDDEYSEYHDSLISTQMLANLNLTQLECGDLLLPEQALSNRDDILVNELLKNPEGKGFFTARGAPIVPNTKSLEITRNLIVESFEIDACTNETLALRDYLHQNRNCLGSILKPVLLLDPTKPKTYHSKTSETISIEVLYFLKKGDSKWREWFRSNYQKN